eukprot:2065638-Amphidinium_carterae.1
MGVGGHRVHRMHIRVAGASKSEPPPYWSPRSVQEPKSRAKCANSPPYGVTIKGTMHHYLSPSIGAWYEGTSNPSGHSRHLAFLLFELHLYIMVM